MSPNGTTETVPHPGLLACVQALFCDADGNLFPSEEPAFEASARVTARFLAEHGIDRRYDPEELRLATTGLNYRTTLTALANEHGIELGDQLQTWVHAEQQAVTAHLRAVLQPDPMVLEPLTELAAHYQVAAVSSSADLRIAASFEVTGMARFFPAERRFSAEDSLPRPTSKPDPAIYLHAMAELGVSADRGLAVEDSVAGATSAVAAGLPTIGNLQFVQAPEREARRAALQSVGVLGVVSSWTEIVDLLGRARSRSDRDLEH